jgi:serine/threonine protein kinase
MPTMPRIVQVDNQVSNQRFRRRISTVVILNWALTIAQGLSDCHGAGYLHHDLTPGNSNFDFASFLNRRSRMLTIHLSPFHISLSIRRSCQGDRPREGALISV